MTKLCVKDSVTKLCVCDKVMCDKVMCDKVMCDKVVFVTKLCVCVRRRRWRRRGIQNQKQEPHTKSGEKTHHARNEHFWKLRCRKSARRCGAKHISKSKCTKHTRPGPLLEVEMSKKCTPLWREADFEVKMHKTHQARTTFGS